MDLKIFPKTAHLLKEELGFLLRDASIVIAFNSTIVFETIASNRNLIIPNFNNENKLKKCFSRN